MSAKPNVCKHTARDSRTQGQGLCRENENNISYVWNSRVGESPGIIEWVVLDIGASLKIELNANVRKVFSLDGLFVVGKRRGD